MNSSARLNETSWTTTENESLQRSAWAWTCFWQKQGANSRCLADAHRDIRNALDGHWATFAGSLAPSSHVLDIGCGAGIVGRILLGTGNDLRVTGIDLASVARSSDARLRLISETAMEVLPFDDHEFDAAVSQFAFEYGSVVLAARETARVLVPGAPFSFVVHHAHSRIARDDRVRDHALNALLGPRVEDAFLSGKATDLGHEIEAIRLRAPRDVLVQQIAAALRNHLFLGDTARRAIWNAILDALAPERELIAALHSSCVAPHDLDEWLAKLSGPLEITNSARLRRANGEVIAWTIEGAASRHVRRAPRTFDNEKPNRNTVKE